MNNFTIKTYTYAKTFYIIDSNDVEHRVYIGSTNILVHYRR